MASYPIVQNKGNLRKFAPSNSVGMDQQASGAYGMRSEAIGFSAAVHPVKGQNIWACLRETRRIAC